MMKRLHFHKLIFSMLIRSGRSERGLSPGIVLSCLMICFGVCVLFIVISLFDGYVKSMEDLLLCLTPDLQVLKKNDSEARKYFSQDEINEMIDIVSNTKRTKDKIISDFVLTEDWYLKKEKKQNQEVFFNKGDWIKLYGILSNDERIHCIDPVISGFDSYKISGSGNLSDSNKINLFVFASPFINGKTSSGIDRLLKNKNVKG